VTEIRDETFGGTFPFAPHAGDRVVGRIMQFLETHP
jgi:hypothetical protein